MPAFGESKLGKTLGFSDKPLLGKVGRTALDVSYGGYTAIPRIGGRVISKALGRKKLSPIKEAKEMLAADVAKLKSGDIEGMTESQMQANISRAQSAAGAQAGASQAALARQALAGQGFQSGAFGEAQRGVQEETQAVGVKAAADEAEVNRQMIAAESNRIRGDLDAARERAKQAAMNTRKALFGAVGGVLTAIGGLIPGVGGIAAKGTGGALEGASAAEAGRAAEITPYQPPPSQAGRSETYWTPPNTTLQRPTENVGWSSGT